jgi:mannose/fructose/N-acetylgalactosamine-specific phosphotransferase system component IIC
MTLSLAQILAVAVLGGFTALDATSVGQFMLSRPFVAATLGGMVAGRPAQGVVAGLVLEALHLAVLPVGAARYPEGGPAGVAAGAVFASQLAPVAPSATLLVMVVGALALEWLGGRTVERLRQFNVRFAGAPPEGLTPGAVARRHGVPILLDFSRGAVMALLGVGLLYGALLAMDFTGFPDAVARVVLRLAVVAGLASALRLFGRGYYPLFAAGAALAALVAWLR